MKVDFNAEFIDYPLMAKCLFVNPTSTLHLPVSAEEIITSGQNGKQS